MSTLHSWSGRRRGPRTAVTVAALVAFTLPLAACGANENSGTGTTTQSSGPSVTQKGGTMHILTQQTSINWDPASSQNLAITTLGLVERRLTTWDVEPGKEAKVVPDMATDTGTPSNGGKTWTYHLKKGLTFQDGTPITSKDVKYSVERSFAPELSGGLSYHKNLLVGGSSYTGPYKGKELASIQTPDDSTIVFNLNTAYGDWPWIASMPAFGAVPKAKDNVTTYSEKPVASGPYEVSQTKEGASVTLVRNPKWNQKTDPVRTAGPDKIVFELGQDPTVSSQRLIADSGADQNAFGADFIPAAQLAQAESDPSAKSRLVTSGPGSLQYLAINTKAPGLDNVKVRQGIEYAVDKKAFLIASGGSNSGQIASTIITPGIEGYKNYNLYKAPETGDSAKAKQLLAEGHWSGRTLKLVVPNDPTSLAQAQAIEQGLRRAGLKVSIIPQEQDVWTQTVSQGDGSEYDLTIAGWQPDFPSANGNIQPLFDSSQIGNGGFNLSRYSSPDVDKLIAQATAETDRDKAAGIWQQADERIMQDAPIVPIIYAKNTFLHGSKVANFFVPAFPSYPNYLKVSLTK